MLNGSWCSKSFRASSNLHRFLTLCIVPSSFIHIPIFPPLMADKDILLCEGPSSGTSWHLTVIFAPSFGHQSLPSKHAFLASVSVTSVSPSCSLCYVCLSLLCLSLLHAVFVASVSPSCSFCCVCPSCGLCRICLPFLQSLSRLSLLVMSICPSCSLCRDCLSLSRLSVLPAVSVTSVPPCHVYLSFLQSLSRLSVLPAVSVVSVSPSCRLC